jgi:hypothetical protein
MVVRRRLVTVPSLLLYLAAPWSPGSEGLQSLHGNRMPSATFRHRIYDAGLDLNGFGYCLRHGYSALLFVIHFKLWKLSALWEHLLR